MGLVTAHQALANPVRKSPALTIVASAAFVLTGVVNTFLGPILPVLANRWSLSDAQSSYFFAMQFMGSMLGVSISSVLLPRRSFRFCIGISYLLMAVGVIGLQGTNWKVALLGTFASGIGLGIVVPSTNLLIAALNPKRPAAALSLVNLCWGLGAVIAPLVLAWTEYLNQVRAFLPALSVVLLATAIVFWFTPSTARQDEPADPESAPWRTTGRFLVMLAAMFFLYVCVEASIGGWIATLAKRAPSGVDQPWVLAPAFFWAGLIAGRGFAPFTLKRVSERALTLSGLGVACLGICVLVFSPHKQWITGAAVVIGWGLAAVFPITVALLSQFGNAAKRIAGPMFAMTGLGGAVMPWLVGVISTQSGSLRAGLVAPLLAAVVLLGLHLAANHGRQSLSKFITGTA